MASYQISVHLFGKPSWEMEIDETSEVDGQTIRRCRDELNERLTIAADIVDKLRSRSPEGTQILVGQYEVICYFDDFESAEQLDSFLRDSIGLTEREMEYLDIAEVEPEESEE